MDARIANLLEYKAEALLARFDPILLEAAQATPLGRFGKWLGSEYGVRFGGREALGSDDSGRCLARMGAESGLVRFDPCMEPNGPLFRFLLVRMVGHWALHREAARNLLGGAFFVHRRDLALLRRAPQTARQAMNDEANRFAAALLLPRLSLSMAIALAQDRMGGTRRPGLIFLDMQPENVRLFRGVLHQLRVTYGVSRSLILWRLRELGWLVEHRCFRPGELLRSYLHE